VVVSANTAQVGPGYHQFLCSLFHRLGEALDVAWLADDRTTDVGDPTGFFHTGDKAALERQMLDWVKALASDALAMRERGGQVSMPLGPGHTFHARGALLTPLGPRDDSWLREVQTNPAKGKDLFPWWDAASDARALLGRAHSLLWTQLVWRPPLFDSERAFFREVCSLLQAAYREDPSLAYPWVEWRELLGYLGVGGTLAEEVARRAALSKPGLPIGYRRADVEVSLGEGWSIRVPGAMAEERLADGTWLARDHRRSVRFVPLDATTPSPAELSSPGDTSLVHQGIRVFGRATLQLGAPHSTLVALLEGPGRKALCSIQFDDPDDAEWAQSTWRSVDCVGTVGSQLLQ
jgi:hypothetical protein